MKQPYLAPLLSLVLVAACAAAPPAVFTGTPTATLSAATAPPVLASPTSTPSAVPSATATRPPAATPFFGQMAIPQATVRYYRVEGATAAELRAALDANGLLDEAGDRGDALTEWYINWHWPGLAQPGCDLQAVKLAYYVQVFLPRWEPPAEASPALRLQWTGYLQALAAHEQGHVDNFVANHQAVAEAIRAATCLTAEAAAQSIIAVFRAYDAHYDAVTGHGAAQGAVFP